MHVLYGLPRRARNARSIPGGTRGARGSGASARPDGICGLTPQAVAEAVTARELGYHLGLVSLGALRSADQATLLEALDPDDADLILGMKDKKMIYPGITYELVASTFPGLLPEKEEAPVGKERAQPKKVACPFGCKSSSEDGLYLPGPLAMHIKKVHGSSDESEDS